MTTDIDLYFKIIPTEEGFLVNAVRDDLWSIGMAYVRYEHEHRPGAYLEEVNIDVDERRRGVGTMLIRLVIAELARRRVASLWCLCAASNDTSRAFLQTFGFDDEPEDAGDDTTYFRMSRQCCSNTS